VPVADFEEIREALTNETLVESIRTDQLKKHPLQGQVDFDSLKLPAKTAR